MTPGSGGAAVLQAARKEHQEAAEKVRLVSCRATAAELRAKQLEASESRVKQEVQQMREEALMQQQQAEQQLKVKSRVLCRVLHKYCAYVLDSRTKYCESLKTLSLKYPVGPTEIFGPLMYMAH
jgi:hypothetical protein